MASSKYSIGELIELCTEVNSSHLYGPNDVRGMTITKQIIPTKANVESTDLSRFLVVHPREFVYNPRTHGAKIGFGFNDSGDSLIISWNNIAFRIRDDRARVVLPEYLFLHFNRAEWDREACYRSWGSSTEVFSWEALCEMELDLPPVPIQQRYVDIYNAMLENQHSYERGLEDLKLTIDATIDKLKHTAPRAAVGTLLEDVDQRNVDGTLSDVLGINIDKQFMPSVANLDGVDLTRYKIVLRNQFAYSSMQTGRDECIRIALHRNDAPILVSPAYAVLQRKSNDVLEEYIMMWFSRNESDRLGWFMSDASIRANLDLVRFYEIEIPLPTKEQQKALVNIYNVYISRKETNERLKAQLKDLCPILIKGSREEAEKE